MDNSQEQITGDDSSIASEGVGENDAATAPLKYSTVWDDTQLECYYDSASKNAGNVTGALSTLLVGVQQKLSTMLCKWVIVMSNLANLPLMKNKRSCTRIYFNTVVINAP